jgi:ribonuclease P protein component
MPAKPVFLKSDADFSLFKKSRSLDSANFKVRWHIPRNQNHPRFGFIVPKKVLSRVTARNAVKRRLKTYISSHLLGFRPLDILFFPKPGSIKLKFRDLTAELEALTRKAGIWQ